MEGALRGGCGGLAGSVPSGEFAGAHGGLPSAENVTCHKDGIEIEFSRELSNYSWHVWVVGRYCCCPGPPAETCLLQG